MDKKPKLHLLLTNSFQERVSWIASTSAPATAHGRLSQVERFFNPLYQNKIPSHASTRLLLLSNYMWSPSQPWAVDPEANRQTARLLLGESEGREEQGCHKEQTGKLILLKINVIIKTIWGAPRNKLMNRVFHKNTFWRIRYFALLIFCLWANTNWC